MKKKPNVMLSLRDEPFFRSASDPLIERVEHFVYHRSYEPRQIIYFPDDPCDHVYWIREGRVKISRKAPGRRELTCRHLFPGHLFGEECLLGQNKRGTYAEALAGTVLCLMRAADFRRLAGELAELGLLLTEHLCQRALDTEQILFETVFKAVRARVASGLLRLYRQTPPSEGGTLLVTHQEIANLIGSTRETTTATLHWLRREGILTIANRRVIVLDPAALEQAARSG